MVTLIKNKEKKLAVWALVSVLGYIMIMGLTFADNSYDTRLFHIESEWSAIGILVATPFVFAFLPKLRLSAAAWLFTGIVVVRLIYIISFLPPFSARNDMEEQILSQMRRKGITKLALASNAHLRSIANLDWALTYESILMSSLDGDKRQYTFLFINPSDKNAPERLKDPKTYVDEWGVLPCASLNKAYYNIDSTNPYQVMTYEELMK